MAPVSWSPPGGSPHRPPDPFRPPEGYPQAGPYPPPAYQPPPVYRPAVGQAGRTVAPGPVLPGGPGRRRRRRWLFVLAGVAAGLVLLAGLVVVGLILLAVAYRAPDARAPVPDPAARGCAPAAATGPLPAAL